MSNDRDRDRIARRHDDIPQDALIPPPPPGHDTGAKREPWPGEPTRPGKVIRQAHCPSCWRYSHKTVAVIREIDLDSHKMREVFKAHTKMVGAGSIPCAGSGTQAPPRG